MDLSTVICCKLLTNGTTSTKLDLKIKFDASVVDYVKEQPDTPALKRPVPENYEELAAKRRLSPPDEITNRPERSLGSARSR